MKARHIILLALFICMAQAGAGEDIGGTLLHHVSDGQSWAPLPFAPSVELSDLNIFGLKIRFTRHVLMLLISAGIVATLSLAAFSNAGVIPNGVGAFLEPVLLFIRDSVVYPIMGEEQGRQWMGFFATLFLFILTANFIGMIPLFSTATGNINVTLGLAGISFACIIGNGVVHLGPVGFFANMAPHGIPKPIAFFIVLIETAGIFIKGIVLAVRLFANMLAGHFVMVSLIALIFIVHPLAALLSVPMALFISMLEILVVVIQAFVFTLLSVIFIGSAASGH